MKGYKHKPENYVPVYSRLKFIKRTVTKSGGSKALYECKCGNIVEVLMGAVKKGRTKSCGCFSVDYPSHYIHGLTTNPLYDIWYGIYTRCYRRNHPSYVNYGSRGVFMCDDWLCNPSLFIDWALSNGWEPGLEVDKDIICNELELNPSFYSPDTCTIVTKQENANHKRTNRYITYNGMTKTITEWSRIYGIKQRDIDNRIKSNWSLDNVFNVPSSRNNSGRRNNKRNMFLCK